MDANLGYSFAPTTANAEDGRRGGSPPVQAQGALRTINYSLPRVAGAASFSPLVGSGSGGSPFSSAVLESVFRTVFGSDAIGAMSGQSSGGPDTSAPSNANTYGGWQGEERALPPSQPATASPFTPVTDAGVRGVNGLPRSPTPAPVIRPGDDGRLGSVEAPAMPAFGDTSAYMNKLSDKNAGGYADTQIVGGGYV